MTTYTLLTPEARQALELSMSSCHQTRGQTVLQHGLDVAATFERLMKGES